MICKNCGRDNPQEARFCANCGATLSATAVASLKATWLPGVISSYRNGWQRLWKNFLELFLIWPIGYGAAFAYLKSARGDALQVKDMFQVFRNYWDAVLARFLVMVITIVGLALLVIPGIYFACKLAFTPYLVADRKMEAIAAIKESWRMTNGHFWKIFLTGLLAIPIAIGGLICLVVGVIISAMWIELAFASLYHAVSTSGAPAPAPGTPST